MNNAEKAIGFFVLLPSFISDALVLIGDVLRHSITRQCFLPLYHRESTIVFFDCPKIETV